MLALVQLQLKETNVMFTNDSRFALVPASVKSAITSALQANEETFVLRDVYEWLGFSQYGHCKRAFDNCEFSEDLDFTRVSRIGKSGNWTRDIEEIQMTADCFKAFAMQVRTERGKQVRLYYIECERQLKSIVQEQQQLKPASLKDSDVVELAFEALGRIRNLHKSNAPGLEQLFFTYTDERALPPEHKTAKEIAGDRIHKNYLSAFGRYLTGLYVELHRTEPPKKLEDGRMVNSYPYTLWNAIDTYMNRR